MNLKAPKPIVFQISVGLVIISGLAHAGIVRGLPSWWILLAAYLLLLGGNLFKRL